MQVSGFFFIGRETEDDSAKGEAKGPESLEDEIDKESD